MIHIRMKLINMVLILSVIARSGVSELDTILGTVGDQLINLRYIIRGPSIQSSLFDKDTEEYDFVVVGAGSAGCVLAARLSENPNWTILLIEAGPSESPLGQVPNKGSLLVTTQYGWTYKSTPQNNSCFGETYNQVNTLKFHADILGRPHNECILRTGRGLGGGSAINGIVYARGSASDFNEWAAAGNAGWSYGDVLPYFKKSENVKLKHFDSQYHGRGGPLTVEDYGQLTPETKAFLAAGNELGYDIIDYNGAKSVGVSGIQFISKKGRRQSTSKVYLEPLRRRKNLIIKTGSHAIRILFDEKKNVKGVIYRREKRYLRALIKKELIVSCGALNSAQLLMVSGIGPAEHLASFGIPSIKDLKVGYNLLDHFNFIGINFYYDFPRIDNNIKSSIDWLLYGNGTFRSSNVDAIAYLKTNLNLNYSDIELMVLAETFSHGAGLLKMTTNLEEHVYNSMWRMHEGKGGFGIMVLLTKPKSVGRLKLRSNSTLIQPRIDLNYLSRREDVETLLKGIRLALKFGGTASFKKLGVNLNTLKVAGCERYPFDSDQYWLCAIPILHISAYHYHGTCKMGPSHDPAAVVDNELRVYGVNRLRVVDASVIPIGITGHLEATAVMIAEKAGDLIKTRY